MISEMLKEARKEANMTQQLAEKVGTKKVVYPDWKTESAISSFQHSTGYLKQGLANK
ncbi:helix-turn-helix transcriptional regulator [Proteiniphilum sp.]|uniref:helix-turn-helix transcriptional regulator n=1 Tax=Proteiniphilum sp. TaxID=1926877 RepID=UPI003329B992